MRQATDLSSVLQAPYFSEKSEALTQRRRRTIFSAKIHNDTIFQSAHHNIPLTSNMKTSNMSRCETYQDSTSSAARSTMDNVALSETIRAMMNVERSTYAAPSKAIDFCSEQIYSEYIKAGRGRARSFFASFAASCPTCPPDFVLLALMTLDRFMATYEPSTNKKDGDETTPSSPCIEDCEWYTIVLTVLQLIFKMNMPPGYAPPSFKAFTDSYGGSRLKCTPHDMSRMEMKVLYELSFHVTPTIYRDYVHYYAQFLPMDDCLEFEGEPSSTSIGRSQVIIDKAIELGRKYATDAKFIGVEQSVLAFICMRYVLREDASCSFFYDGDDDFALLIKRSDVLLFEHAILNIIDCQGEDVMYGILLQAEGRVLSKKRSYSLCTGDTMLMCSCRHHKQDEYEEVALVSDVESVTSSDDVAKDDDDLERDDCCRPSKRVNASRDDISCVAID